MLGLFVTGIALIIRFSIWTTAGWHDLAQSLTF